MKMRSCLSLSAGILIGVAVMSLMTQRDAARADCTGAPCEKPPCCNGDANADTKINVADAIYLLAYLFAKGPEPMAIAACGPMDVAGRWRIVEPYQPDTCGDPDEPPFIATIAQDGNKLTVDNGDANLPGVIDGNRAYWSGSYAEDGGTTSLEGFMVVDPDGTKAHGVTWWTWTDGFESCRGVEVNEATRQ